MYVIGSEQTLRECLTSCYQPSGRHETRFNRQRRQSVRAGQLMVACGHLATSGPDDHRIEFARRRASIPILTCTPAESASSPPSGAPATRVSRSRVTRRVSDTQSLRLRLDIHAQSFACYDRLPGRCRCGRPGRLLQRDHRWWFLGRQQCRGFFSWVNSPVDGTIRFALWKLIGYARQ